MVACFGTLNQDFFGSTGVWISPYIAQTYTGLNFIYILSAGTATSESIPFDFAFIDHYIELFCFGQHGYGCGGSMHAPLSFSSRNTLYAVYPRFIFQCSVHIVARNAANNFLESACCAFVDAGYFHPPTFCFAIFGVHAEKVSGKDSGFVTACTSTNFEDGVLAVLWVGRYEEEFDMFFQFRLACLTGIQFFACHFPHLRVCFIGDDLFGFLDAIQHLDIFFTGLHQVAQFFVLFGEFNVTLLVGNHCRVCNQRRYFFEAGNKPFEFL